MKKNDLIHKLKQIDGLISDEKAAIIILVNTNIKYGPVWEDKPEAVEEQLRKNLPVLREVAEKRILGNALHKTKAAIFNCPKIWDSSLPSAFSLFFRAFQYFLGLGLPVKTSITSIIEKYHFSTVSFQSVLTFFSSKIYQQPNL